MFRNVLTSFVIALAILTVFSGNAVHAQLLPLPESSNTSSVTIGTTTHSILFPQASLRSVQSRLQDILYYLRTLDSDEIIETAAFRASITDSTSNPDVYSDIINFAFDEEEKKEDQIVGGVIANVQGCHVFSGDFEIGSRNAEILKIQQFLNRFPETRVAETGPGSPGDETEYFGSLTFSAVIAFQSRYADVILTPLGITNPTGYWGASSRSHANKLSGCQ